MQMCNVSGVGGLTGMQASISVVRQFLERVRECVVEAQFMIASNHKFVFVR